MSNITFVKQPGFIYDLFSLFTIHFNEEYCLKNYVNPRKGETDVEYYKTLCDEFSPMSDELILFFNLMDDKKNFMSTYLFEPYCEKLSSDEFNMAFIYDAINDYEYITENLIKYYFRDVDDKTLENCRNSASALNKLIKNSNYNSDVKSALYSFFIEPEPVIRKLCDELKEKEAQLKQKYSKLNKKIAKVQEKFDFNELSIGLKSAKMHQGNLTCFENVSISFCMFNKNVIKTRYGDKIAIVILGLEYIDTIDYLLIQQETPELDVFGNVLSEINRVYILNLILSKGEVTIKEIEQKFGLTGTNSYYHITLMIKAGMLKTRNQGRTILYSINKNYFRMLCGMLEKYHHSEEDEE